MKYLDSPSDAEAQIGIPPGTNAGSPNGIGCSVTLERVTIEVSGSDEAPMLGEHQEPLPTMTTPDEGPQDADPSDTNLHDGGTESWAFPKSTGNHPGGDATRFTAGIVEGVPGRVAPRARVLSGTMISSTAHQMVNENPMASLGCQKDLITSDHASHNWVVDAPC
jgi:hypothetical protein